MRDTTHYTREQIKERFHVYYSIQDRGYLSPCWIWHSWSVKKPYGRIVFENKRQQAHRVSFQLFKGPIGSGMQVCHHCDVPACVNPEHLFQGTNQDNMTDLKMKGRRKNKYTGENHHESKLTVNDVINMRELRANLGLTYKQIGEQFGVKKCTAHAIINHKSWTHVKSSCQEKNIN